MTKKLLRVTATAPAIALTLAFAPTHWWHPFTCLTVLPSADCVDNPALIPLGTAGQAGQVPAAPAPSGPEAVPSTPAPSGGN